MSDHGGSDNSGTAHTPQRPRLVLKPRDEDAARKAELERQQKSQKANPFGNAKPREAVLAQRTGKTEEEILREAVKTDRAKLPLNAQQQEEKQAAEESISEIQAQIEEEDNGSKKKLLEEELKRREDALDELLSGFEKLYLEAVAKGEVSRPSERRQLTKPDSDTARDTYKPRTSHQGYSSNLSYGSPNDERRSQPGWNGGRGRKPGFSDVQDKDVSRQGSYNSSRNSNYNTNNSFRTNRTYDNTSSNNGSGKDGFYNSGESRGNRSFNHSYDDRGRGDDFIGRGDYVTHDFGSAFGTTHERKGGANSGRYPPREGGKMGGSSFGRSRDDETYQDYPGMGPPMHF